MKRVFETRDGSPVLIHSPHLRDRNVSVCKTTPLFVCTTLSHLVQFLFMSLTLTPVDLEFWNSKMGPHTHDTRRGNKTSVPNTLLFLKMTRNLVLPVTSMVSLDLYFTQEFNLCIPGIFL